jgi:fimbrial chaperone protein
MMGIRSHILSLAALLLTSLPASSATLGVSPVLVDISMPRTHGKLSLENRGQEPIDIQVRVFRWEKKDGRDHLVPTKDVMASPPMAKLKPGSKYALRIVRVAKHEVRAEESYRLLIDQLPKRTNAQGTHVSFLIRQSIPVFLSPAAAKDSSLSWSARIENGRVVLAAKNAGARRAKLSSIKLTSREGEIMMQKEGLAGYVLAGSTAVWAEPALRRFAPGTKLTITAQDENGPIEASAILGAAD